MASLEDVKEAIIKGKRRDSARLVQEALDEGHSVKEVLEACIGGMDVVGERFQKGEAFVPEMLVAARSMKAAMGVLEPLLTDAGLQPEHTAVVGTVEGDLHDIGKNLVSMMWKGANFGVVDLGTNVTADDFVNAIKENNAKIVGLSALLTTTMPAMRATVEKIRAEIGDDVKVLVGGAPITQKFADDIGADGYAADAASAVTLARQAVKA
jgi:5-methyltetrahydrofolate--homocysteine methyltransferase